MSPVPLRTPEGRAALAELEMLSIAVRAFLDALPDLPPLDRAAVAHAAHTHVTALVPVARTAREDALNDARDLHTLEEIGAVTGLSRMRVLDVSRAASARRAMADGEAL